METQIQGSIQTITYKPEERPKRSADLDKIGAALAKAQGKIKNAAKDAQGVHGNYATLASTWDAIRDPLSETGIALYQRPMLFADGKLMMCTMLLHESGQFLDDSELELKFDPGSRMNAMQALGSAVTYARRYTSQSATGVAPTDDDDGVGSGEPQQQNNNRSRQNNSKNENKSGKSEQGAPKNENQVLGLDYVMPFGDAGVKGSKLNDLDDKVLGNILNWTVDELKKTPKVKNAQLLVTVQANVQQAIRSRKSAKENIKQDTLAKDDIPENQIAPNYENESQEQKQKPKDTKPDPADFVVPATLDSLGDYNGKALRQIPEKVLKAAIKELETVMQKVPPPSNVSDLFAVVGTIKAFLKSMGVS